MGDVEGDWIVRYIHESMVQPQFLVFTGGGPAVTNSQGMPWSGAYVNANGDLTVDLRSDIAAESRAKIVYEYLLQFTDDPHVHDSLRFLMTREIAHFQMFSAALETIQPNFPPGVLQGDPRFTHTFFNMSNSASAEGPRSGQDGLLTSIDLNTISHATKPSRPFDRIWTNQISTNRTIPDDCRARRDRQSYRGRLPLRGRAGANVIGRVATLSTSRSARL